MTCDLLTGVPPESGTRRFLGLRLCRAARVSPVRKHGKKDTGEQTERGQRKWLACTC